MRECDYIEYLAHMLDESMRDKVWGDLGDRSYYAVWSQEFPQYADQERLKAYLARLFDRYVVELDGIDGKLKAFAVAYENSSGIPYNRAMTSLLAAFKPDEITNRNYFWEPIPARVYRAVVSRNRAKAQGQVSREVSPKVLKDCLDAICRSASIIDVHDAEMLPSLRRTQTYRKLAVECGNRTLADTLVQDLYLAFSSFTTFENGNAYDAVYDRLAAKYPGESELDVLENHFDEFQDMMWKAIREEGAGQWLCNQSDGELGTNCLKEMRKVPYDVCERPEDAVPLISKLIDWSHIRGDVAGAFVEGGAPTCLAVSNMKPDELYESKSPLLNAFSKIYGENFVFSSIPVFEWTEENVNMLYTVLDQSFFNGKFSKKFKADGFEIFAGSPAELNAIAIPEYTKNPAFDINAYLALYMPKTSIIRKNDKYSIIKYKDAVFVNLSKQKTTTLAYAISVLAHEMIHCLDANEGTLLKTTQLLMDKGVPWDVIDYTSHFTELFKRKRTAMKREHGITINIDGSSRAFEDIDAQAAAEIQLLRESDATPDMTHVEFTDEQKEKYKNIMYDNGDGTVTFFFGQRVSRVDESVRRANPGAHPSPPADEFECARFDITDEFLNKAQIVAYMYGQTIENAAGEDKPYNPKTFPEKAIDIIVKMSDDFIVDIFLDSRRMAWDSRFRYGGNICCLGPDQMEQFFGSEFYAKMTESLRKKWPLTDPTFGRMFEAVLRKRMRTGLTEEDLGGLNEKEGAQVDQPNKRADLANKDITGDGERDYTSTGRKICHFGDNGVKGNSGQYYCWPNPKFPFKWSQWKDWKKIKPLCKMSFVYNGRRYGIALSLFDENFENRGFRGYDADWRPPLGWLTPGEADQIMQLSIVKKFTRQCVKNIKKYVSLPAEEVYKRINNKDKITLEEIRKTIRVIKHVVNTALKDHAADTYCFESEA